MICTKCKAKLDEDSQFCNYCGQAVKKQEASKNSAMSLKKIIVIGFSVTVCSILLGVATFYFTNNPLSSLVNKVASQSENEKAVLKSIETLKARLKNPSSLELFDDVLILDLGTLNDLYIYIDYGAMNGFGGTVRSTAMFCNGEYIGNTDDDRDDISILNIDKYDIASKAYIAWKIDVHSLSTYTINSSEKVSKDKINQLIQK